MTRWKDARNDSKIFIYSNGYSNFKISIATLGMKIKFIISKALK
ncbi:hypothetical protein [Thermodesulfovibrio hydrogeniphilus]